MPRTPEEVEERVHPAGLRGELAQPTAVPASASTLSRYSDGQSLDDAE
jgi:hypothetical protein